MDFVKKTKGAVSIFLVIILVPMMTVSALFVDASKISLARSVAASAGDLTLNTALTDYDTMLKDMYGLFATAQNTDELYESLEDYYRTCITSSGVSEVDADSLVGQIMSQLALVGEDSDTSDMLNMQLVDFDVSKHSDANLANATILEKQIVDFMKYRGPINTGLSFLSAIQTLKTLSKQSELVDKRQEYYTQQQTVMETLETAWKEINAYNSLDLIKKSDFFSTMKADFNNSDKWQNRYKIDVNRKMIMDLYDTQSYIDYYCSIVEITEKAPTASGSKFDAEIWKFTYTATGSTGPLKSYIDYYPKSVGGYDKGTLPTEDEITTLMNAFYKNLQSMDSYKAMLTHESSPDDVYDLQYLVQANRKDLKQYTSSVSNVYTTYQKLKNAMVWVEAYSDKDKTALKNEEIEVNSKTDTLANHFAAIEKKYEETMRNASALVKVFSDIAQNLPAGITNTSGVSGVVKGISDSVSYYVNTLDSAAKHLDKAADLITSAKTSVSGGDLSKAKEAWKSAADDSELKNTPMGRQDKAEIQELGTYLNTADMDKMIGRLRAISANLKKNIEQIKGYKFDGTFIGDIKDYSGVKAAIERKVGAEKLKSVELSKEKLISQADGWFDWQSGSLNVDWINDSGTQVRLHGETDKLNFYSYLYTHFNTGEVSSETTTKQEDESNGKSLYDDIKTKSESKATDSSKGTDAGNISSDKELLSLIGEGWPSYNKGGSETPSAKVKTGESAAKDTSASLSTMFQKLAAAAVDLGTDLRDKLYVSDYIISMFSYDTIENEKKVEKKDGDLTTLTLTPINATNNYAYGKEVEYIIYGGENASNLVKAYGSIYGIRFGFNVIYAFTDSSIRDTAFAIATPISAATLGVIPVPLIQAAIIIGIACCESALDLQELKSGESVPLFKNKNTWKCSIKGLMTTVKKSVGDALTDFSETAVDEGLKQLNELLDKTDDELNEFIKGNTDKVVDAATTSFDTLVARHANTAIQKLTTLCNNAIEEHMREPATNMVNKVNQGLDEWLAEEGSNVDKASDLGYIVKAEAVKIIKEKYVQTAIDQMQQIAEKASGAVADAANMLGELMEKIKKEISRAIVMASDKVIEYKEKMKSKVKESMKDGAGKLKEALNKQIDGVFGSGAGTDSADSTGMASLLSFSYSDYLRLFLMIGLYQNESAILLRTGDVIQANMRQKPENKDFQLSKSATYLDFYAKVQVKPTLLALPLFAQVEKNPVEESGWYTIEYEATKGY